MSSAGGQVIGRELDYIINLMYCMYCVKERYDRQIELIFGEMNKRSIQLWSKSKCLDVNLVVEKI